MKFLTMKSVASLLVALPVVPFAAGHQPYPFFDERQTTKRDVQEGGQCGSGGNNAACAAGLCCSSLVRWTPSEQALFFFFWPRWRVKSRLLTSGCVEKVGMQFREVLLRIPSLPDKLRSRMRRQPVAPWNGHVACAAAALWRSSIRHRCLQVYGTGEGRSDV